MNTSFQISNNLYLYILIIFFIFVYIFWLFKFVNKSKISKINKYSIIIFRTIATLIFILFIINLKINIKKTIVKKPIVAFVWDDSKSMGKAIEDDNYSKIIMNSEFYSFLNNQANIKHYYGHDKLTEINYNKINNIKYNGNYTNISNMLFSAIAKNSEDDLNSIILVSDGQSHYGKMIDNMKLKNDVKIHSIGIGKTENVNNIELVNLEKPNIIKENKEFSLKLNLKNKSKNNLNGVVKYRINNDKMQYFSDVNILGEREVVVEKKISALNIGEYKLSFYYVPEAEDTVILINDKQKISVNKSQFDIVFCYDIPSPDIKFMKLVLSENENYNLFNYNDWIKNNSMSNPDLIICYSNIKDNILMKDKNIPKFIFVNNDFQNIKNKKAKYIENFVLNEKYSFLFVDSLITKSVINWKKIPPVFWNGSKIVGDNILSEKETKISLMSWDEKNNSINCSITKMWRWKLSSYNKEWNGHYSKLINGMVKWLINNNQRKIINIEENIISINKYENIKIPININLTQNNIKDSLEVICMIYDDKNSELLRNYIPVNSEKIYFNYKPVIEGKFKLISQLVSNNVPLASDSVKLEVNKGNNEVFIGCDEYSLRKLSHNSNGIFVKLNNINLLHKLIHLKNIELFKNYYLISRTNIVLLILLLLVSIAEWIVRKQNGYL